MEAVEFCLASRTTYSYTPLFSIKKKKKKEEKRLPFGIQTVPGEDPATQKAFIKGNFKKIYIIIIAVLVSRQGRSQASCTVAFFWLLLKNANALQYTVGKTTC